MSSKRAPRHIWTDVCDGLLREKLAAINKELEEMPTSRAKDRLEKSKWAIVASELSQTTGFKVSVSEKACIQHWAVMAGRRKRSPNNDRAATSFNVKAMKESLHIGKRRESKLLEMLAASQQALVESKQALMESKKELLVFHDKDLEWLDQLIPLLSSMSEDIIALNGVLNAFPAKDWLETIASEDAPIKIASAQQLKSTIGAIGAHTHSG